MKTAFICYETQDLGFAERLVADLDKRKVISWLDVRELSGSEVRDVEIPRAIQRNECFLIILSKNSANSKQVLFEFAYAKVDNKVIIPILIEDCIIPKQLQRGTWIDFRSNYQNGLEQVIECLASQETLSKADADHEVVQPKPKELLSGVVDRKTSELKNVLDQSKSIELRESRVVGDVFIGEKQTNTEAPERVFQVKPLIQIITISIGLIGIGFPIWWFLNNSSKDVLGYLLPLLIVVLSIVITLIGILAPDQLVKIIMAALGSKKE